MGVQGSVVQQNKNQMGSTLKNFQKVNTELGSISAVAFIYNFNALLNLIRLLDLETRVNGECYSPNLGYNGFIQAIKLDKSLLSKGTYFKYFLRPCVC